MVDINSNNLEKREPDDGHIRLSSEQIMWSLYPVIWNKIKELEERVKQLEDDTHYHREKED